MRVVRFAFYLSLVAAAPLLRAEDVLTVANRLAHQHLGYIYGSEDPARGGLDCSGFVKYVIHEASGIELPDEADRQLEYCRDHGQVWDATSNWTPATLQPGDLIFFAGPQPLARNSLICHVMIYCGNHVMVGAQGEGRQMDGTMGGVGFYPIPDRPPTGILGESGERFIGHRRIFAYGRLNGMPPISVQVLALLPVYLPEGHLLNASSKYD